MKYSILIQTYCERFNEWFKPLIFEIKRQRPEVEVIVAVNGELGRFDDDYRKNILDFLKDFKNVFPTLYPRFRSYARKSNLGIQFATEDVVLTMNDDITMEQGFFDNYEHVLKDYQTFTVNTSFTVTSIIKKDLMAMGWFDERLLGMGWEDGDFLNKYERYKGSKLPNTNIETCKNGTDKKFYSFNDKLARYMKNEKRLPGQRLDTEFNRYSEYNRVIFEAELSPINPYPLESFYMSNKDKL